MQGIGTCLLMQGEYPAIALQLIHEKFVMKEKGGKSSLPHGTFLSARKNLSGHPTYLCCPLLKSQLLRRICSRLAISAVVLL